jgi:hypothetical protein
MLPRKVSHLFHHFQLMAEAVQEKYLLRSTSGFTALQFGVATDVPIPNAFVP